MRSRVGLCQEPPQRLVAGVLPHAAQRAGLQLPAEPGAPVLRTGVDAAAELQQPAAGAQEPADGAAAGAPQDGAQMTRVSSVTRG